jgi:hypothetical protein
MTKSTRHSKITGDFAEGLVLYWLSKYGYECARVDHTGIDLIANAPDNSERLGISVKCRSRYQGTESSSVNLPSDGFAKARSACKAFGCVPYYAVVVDGGSVVRCFLVSLAHLENIAGGKGEGMRYWQMTAKSMAAYKADAFIKGFELQVTACSWR